MKIIKEAELLLASGDNDKVCAGRKKLQQAAEVTCDIKRKVINKLREEKIPYLVSPFESDAQLTYLVNNNFVDFVISEDSDLIPFGADRVLFKFRSDNMKLYERSKLLRIDSLFPDLTSWRRMCILSGCDYLPSLPGIGPKKAMQSMVTFHNLHKRTESGSLPSSCPPDFYDYLKMLPKYLKTKMVVPDSYFKMFREAELTFLFQLVYDLKANKMVPLNPYNGEVHDGRTVNILNIPFAGKSLSPDLSYQHSIGNLTDDHAAVVPDIAFDPGRKWLCDIKSDFQHLLENVGSTYPSPSISCTPRTQSVKSYSPLSSPYLFDHNVQQISPRTSNSSMFTPPTVPPMTSHKRKSLSPHRTPKRGRKGYGDCPFPSKDTQPVVRQRIKTVSNLSSQGSSFNGTPESLDYSLSNYRASPASGEPRAILIDLTI